MLEDETTHPFRTRTHVGGLREALHSILFAPVGVPREGAVAVSVLVFSQLLLLSAPGLLLWLRQRWEGGWFLRVREAAVHE